MNQPPISTPTAGEPPNPEITLSESEQEALNRELTQELSGVKPRPAGTANAPTTDEIAALVNSGRVKEPPEMRKLSQAKREKLIEASAPDDGVVNVDGARALKARKRAGLSNREWSVAAVRAKLKFGAFLTVPIVSKISLVGVMNSLEQVEGVIKLGKDIANGINRDKDGNITDAKVSDQDKIHAINAVADATKIHMEAVLNAIKVAEFANGKQEQEAGNRPKNKPPSLGIETTASDGTITRVVATSGSATQ